MLHMLLLLDVLRLGHVRGNQGVVLLQVLDLQIQQSEAEVRRLHTHAMQPC